MKEMNEMIVKVGRQYFGSGGYRAGYEVVEGEVRKEFVSDKIYSNGFVHYWYEKLTPVTDVAVIRVWERDGINGGRNLGINGEFILKKA